ncbi:MAG: hypothetical protein ACRENV_08535 [Candidatus Dormibacteria bacterium]
MSSEPTTELHLVSALEDQRAWEHCRQRARAGARVRMLLLHDAVLVTEERAAAWLGGAEVAVVACAEHARRRQVGERWALADYDEIIAQCTQAQRVVSW